MLNRHLLTFVVALVAGVLFNTTALAAAPVSCECEQTACGPCEMEIGVDFYSAKCGPNNSRVKSCKKPQCEPVENQKACLALFHKTERDPAGEKNATSAKEVASRPHKVHDQPVAGDILEVSGGVVISRGGEVAEAPRKLDHVYNDDLIETKADGKIKLRLKDNSEVVLPAKSKLRLDKVIVGLGADKRQVTMNLLMGKVRSRVQKKYDGDNSYEVRTRTAVAGVRGTDFVVSFEQGEKQWVSEIRTVEGRVSLAGAGKGGKSIEVPAGTFAAHMVDAPVRSASDAEIEALAAKGTISPIYQMKEGEAKKMEKDLDYIPLDAVKISVGGSESRTVASLESDEICAAPRGKFNQCSWTCENNPKGEKSCRTDLPGVTCVRKLCLANGQWGEAKRLPASEGIICQPDEAVVLDCGNYW